MAVVRVVGNRFYGKADSAVGGLIAVKPAERGTAGVAAAVAAAKAPGGAAGGSGSGSGSSYL